MMYGAQPCAGVAFSVFQLSDWTVCQGQFVSVVVTFCWVIICCRAAAFSLNSSNRNTPTIFRYRHKAMRITKSSNRIRITPSLLLSPPLEGGQRKSELLLYWRRPVSPTISTRALSIKRRTL